MINNINKIALLATGTEIIEGDILNTNSQQMARALAEHGFTVGTHLEASDTESDIENGLHFLLKDHAAVIITGGLGPTSDDLTRYALSKVIGEELIFDETSWQHIEERYQKSGLVLVPHPTNRQQALFPRNATVLKNANGTANGCWLTHRGKLIFMLPGPPGECLPMFENFVVPVLLKHYPQRLRYKASWRLLGVVESEIAAKIDAAVQNYQVTTGYRLEYPYLEVKIYADDEAVLNTIKPLITELVKTNLISFSHITASSLLKKLIATYGGTIIIEDQATRGWLAATLNTPETFQKLNFKIINQSDKQNTHSPELPVSKPGENQLKENIFIKIAGLDLYWQGQKPPAQLPVYLEIHSNGVVKNIIINVPYRNDLVTKYAVEYIASALMTHLKNI